jgi:GH24 family phage-related lysozyme (muramidase)
MPNAAPAASAGVRLHGISQEAFDLIVEFEVSGEAAYNKRYRRPTRPGGASGITIGIGYDCGYSTAAQIRVDWGGLLPEEMIAALMTVAGVTGARAAAVLADIRLKVDVPWIAALAVFSNTSIPKYLAKASQLPNWDMLSPDCKGALLSLVYNRGPSFDNAGSRYQEMRNIKAHMASGRFSAIPTELRSMKRIWQGQDDMRGLLTRRDKEADLFERGLKAKVAAPTAPKPEPPSPIPTKPPPKPSAWAAFFMAIAAIFKRAK